MTEKRPQVKFTPARTSAAVDEVQAAILTDHANGRVFSRGGQLVEVRDAPPSTALEVQQGAAGVQIWPLDGRRLEERIAKSIDILQLRGKFWEPQGVPRAITETIESRGGRGAPPLIGITAAPVILPNGVIEEDPGYQENTGLYGAFEIGQFPQTRRYTTRSNGCSYRRKIAHAPSASTGESSTRRRRMQAQRCVIWSKLSSPSSHFRMQLTRPLPSLLCSPHSCGP